MFATQPPPHGAPHPHGVLFDQGQELCFKTPQRLNVKLICPKGISVCGKNARIRSSMVLYMIAGKCAASRDLESKLVARVNLCGPSIAHLNA